MGIIYSDQIKNQILKEVGESENSIQIISAYCKTSTISMINEKVPKSVEVKRLMVRFTLDDILCGSTDFDLFNFCSSHDWQFYVKFSLHAKTYVFDDKRSIVGSANLTKMGVELQELGNYEIAALVEMDKSDVDKISDLFSTAILMTTEIFELMNEQLKSIPHDSVGCTYHWNQKIIEKVNEKPTALFLYDFPSSSSPFAITENPLEFLGLPVNSNIEMIKAAFRKSNAYIWLTYILEQNNGLMYFGALAENLHSLLINDPLPYRKEIKVILGNFLSWISELEISEIKIDRPNYSQRVILNRDL